VATLYGPSGLITIPDAYVTPHNHVLVGTHIGHDISGAAHYGLLRSLDLGVGVVTLRNSDTNVLFNAKVNVVPSNIRHVQLGLGFIDLFDTLHQTFYLVASAEWIPAKFLEGEGVGFRAHLGGGTGVFNNNVMGGGEFLFARRFTLLAEYNGRYLNGGLRYMNTQALGIQIGLARGGIFFSTSYVFRP
jgi:hypothetical protein